MAGKSKEKPAATPPDIIPAEGERGFIVGQTGSGKTVFAIWLLMRIKQSPIFIYDTKEEPKFDALTPNVVVTTIEEMDAAYANMEIDYVIVRPPIETTSDPMALDALLLHHYVNYRNSLADIDEAYMFHKGGRNGPGLLALMTRGRSRGITTICSTQRPAWISKFLMSEAQKFYAFFLLLDDDKKRIAGIIPGFDELPDPPKHGFYFFESGKREHTKYGAVRLDRALDMGYTDAQLDPVPELVIERKAGKIWL